MERSLLFILFGRGPLDAPPHREARAFCNGGEPLSGITEDDECVSGGVSLATHSIGDQAPFNQNTTLRR